VSVIWQKPVLTHAVSVVSLTASVNLVNNRLQGYCATRDQNSFELISSCTRMNTCSRTIWTFNIFTAGAVLCPTRLQVAQFMQSSLYYRA